MLLISWRWPNSQFTIYWKYLSSFVRLKTPRSERPSTAWSKKMIKAVQGRVKIFARQMAKYINMRVTSMRRIIKNYLKLLSYKMRKRQHLTPFEKQKRLDGANIFLEIWRLARESKKEIVYFNDKLITIEASVNNQNDAKSSVIDESVRTVYRRKKLFSLMVWAAVSKSWKSPLIFVEQWVKIKTDTLIIFWFQLLKRWKDISKISITSSNKMEHHTTPQ